MHGFFAVSSRTKLFLGFGVMCFLVIGIALGSHTTFVAIQKTEREVVDVYQQAVTTLMEVRSDQYRIRGRMLELLASTDPGKQDGILREVEDRSKEIIQGLERLKTFMNAQDLKKELSLLADLEKELAAYREGRVEETRLVAAGKVDEARLLGGGTQEERFERIREALITLGEEFQKQADAAVGESGKVFGRVMQVFGVVSGLGILFSFFMVWFMDRKLAALIGNLKDLHKELQTGIDILASSSSEILVTVTQVASGATETATAVSETSTTAGEVKQTAHLANQKAKNVQENAQRTTVVSEAGRKSVAETIEGMNNIVTQMESIAGSVVRLSEQGQTIGEIIATVNDLAEQSNLLAVNAAIEATRAGEFGKGFGVVAQEVKSLAEQSRQATTQVRTILMEIQKATSAAVMATEQGSKAVAAGVKQATDAGETIRALAGNIGEAAQAATQIAASSQQQLIGMDQIASAIANIQQATTQNLAGTKQLEVSARNLQELGKRLKDAVERQRVDE